MKKIISFILCALLVLGTMCVSAESGYEAKAARVQTFNLLNKGISPDKEFTRGEAIAALMRIHVRTELAPYSEASVFSDVAADSELMPYSNYAYQMGFVSGMGDGRLAPDEGITLPQFVKIAVSVLGWQNVAEREGGYEGGYMAVAGRIGLLKNVPLANGVLTYEHAVYIIDNMLDIRTLDEVIGADDFEMSADTLYEQLLTSGEMYALSGIVTAVGEAALLGESAVRNGEISVDSVRMEYADLDVSLLGKLVTVRYRNGENDVIPVAVSVYVSNKNEEITIDAESLERLTLSECVYYDEENDKTEVLDLDGVQIVYNGRIESPEYLAIPETGKITLLDHDRDGEFELIFIDEYVSFIVDRVLSATDTLYLEKGYTFRSKNGISFDLDDKDMEYEFLNSELSPISFDDIKAEDVVSVWADRNEEKIRVVVCNEKAEGTLKTKTEDTVCVEDKEYKVYAPNKESFMASYDIGQSGSFAINHAGEIVGVSGELYNKNIYGYVIGYESGSAFKTGQLKVMSSGTKEKKIKVSGGDETINYIYTNGAYEVYDFADKVTVNGTKVSNDTLTSEMFNRSVVAYELNSEGKIKSVDIYSVPSYELANSSYSYNLNGDLNSFGGSYDRRAFYVGESTQMICVPRNAAPDEEDYEVSVTVVENSSYAVVPINIDADNQIAECAVLITDMDAGSLALFSDTDDVSVVGKISNKVDEEGRELYALEVITGEEISQLYIEADSSLSTIVGSLKVGDLIRYEAKSTGEISNISYLASLSKMGNTYFINREYQRNEVSYGQVVDVTTDYLDDFRNERVDKVEVNVGSKVKTYVMPREEGPMFYNYNKKTKLISPAVPEEIQGVAQVGDDASELYMLVCENNPMVVINVTE